MTAERDGEVGPGKGMHVRFVDPQLDAVLRRAFGDAYAWADRELTPPVRSVMLSGDFDEELSYALSLLAHGEDSGDYDFVCAGIYGLFLVAVQSFRATKMDPSEVIDRAQRFMVAMSGAVSSPIEVSDENSEMLAGLGGMVGYSADVRTTVIGGKLKEIVFSRSDGETLTARPGDYVRVDTSGLLRVSDGPDADHDLV